MLLGKSKQIQEYPKNIFKGNCIFIILLALYDIFLPYQEAQQILNI